MEDLAGKVAVITGGAGGIGTAMARRFGAEGMAVVLADIEAGQLESAAAELATDGIEVIGVVTDVTDPASVEALAGATYERFGAAHVLCNNAGVGPAGAVLDMALEDYRWIIDVNLYGVLHGIKAFLPGMLAEGEGHIVNTASVAGLLTQPAMSAYNISKHGVVVLSESLFYELEMMEAPIGVSVVCPAWVPTRIVESERNRPGGALTPTGPITDRVRAAAERFMAASHRTVDEVADAVLDAITENRFYVVTHPGIWPFVERRHEDIRLGRNPSVEQGL
jgi:NAD(P)-dependent dehydrogenase (short-subunit alcohol dehydrogenase family)